METGTYCGLIVCLCGHSFHFHVKTVPHMLLLGLRKVVVKTYDDFDLVLLLEYLVSSFG